MSLGLHDPPHHHHKYGNTWNSIMQRLLCISNDCGLPAPSMQSMQMLEFDTFPEILGPAAPSTAQTQLRKFFEFYTFQ